MKTKFNESTHNRPEGDRLVDGPVVISDLPTYIKIIKKEKAWEKSDRNAITLFKSDKLRVVLVGMRKKAVMKTDKPDHALNIQVLKGRIRLEANGNLYEGDEEQIISLHEKLPYTIKALSKCVLLLTVVE